MIFCLKILVELLETFSIFICSANRNENDATDGSDHFCTLNCFAALLSTKTNVVSMRITLNCEKLSGGKSLAVTGGPVVCQSNHV
jgi:hypothetical protein